MIKYNVKQEVDFLINKIKSNIEHDCIHSGKSNGYIEIDDDYVFPDDAVLYVKVQVDFHMEYDTDGAGMRYIDVVKTSGELKEVIIISSEYELDLTNLFEL